MEGRAITASYGTKGIQNSHMIHAVMQSGGGDDSGHLPTGKDGECSANRQAVAVFTEYSGCAAACQFLYQRPEAAMARCGHSIAVLFTPLKY